MGANRSNNAQRTVVQPHPVKGYRLVKIEELYPLLNNEYLILVGELAARRQVDAYFVGGGLRDFLMGRNIKDFDFALSSGAEEVPVEFARAIGGTFFWLDRQRCHSRVVEKSGSGDLVFDFVPLRGEEIIKDLQLRDFTINALALPLVGMDISLIDPFQGKGDLSRKVIRACYENSFDDDPLRLLRAIRFAATLDFDIEDATWMRLSEKADLLKKVSPERVRDEFFQILTAPGVGASLEKLHESGLLDKVLTAGFFPENFCTSFEKRGVAFKERIGNAVDAEHIVSCSKNAAELRDYLQREVEGGVSIFSLLKLAAFLGEGDNPGLLAAKVAARLRIGVKARRILVLLSGRTVNLFNLSGRNTTKRSMYRFFADREPAGVALLILTSARGDIFRDLAEQLIDFYFQEFPKIYDDILLSGGEIMAILGIGQGREVGEAVELLKKAESAGLINDKEEAREFLKKNLLTKKEPII